MSRKLSRRPFLKMSAVSPIFFTSGSLSLGSKPKNSILGIIEDDEFSIKEDKKFKITDRFSSVKTFSCSSIKFRKYFVRFETVYSFTGDVILWIDDSKEISLDSKLYSFIESKNCTGTTKIVKFQPEKIDKEKDQDDSQIYRNNKTSDNKTQKNYSDLNETQINETIEDVNLSDSKQNITNKTKNELKNEKDINQTEDNNRISLNRTLNNNQSGINGSNINNTEVTDIRGNQTQTGFNILITLIAIISFLIKDLYYEKIKK